MLCPFARPTTIAVAQMLFFTDVADIAGVGQKMYQHVYCVLLLLLL